MVGKLIRRCRNEHGQALVELAFVLPLVLLLLFGIFDFGLALNQDNADTNVANLAARAVSVMGTTTSISCNGATETTLTAWVDCEAAATGAPTPSYVCVADTAGTTPSSTYTTGDPLEVQVSSVFHWLSIISGGDRYIGPVVSPTSTITASATMRNEQDTGTDSFLTPTCTTG